MNVRNVMYDGISSVGGNRTVHHWLNIVIGTKQKQI